jgi:hypothetical protein
MFGGSPLSGCWTGPGCALNANASASPHSMYCSLALVRRCTAGMGLLSPVLVSCFSVGCESRICLSISLLRGERLTSRLDLAKYLEFKLSCLCFVLKI